MSFVIKGNWTLRLLYKWKTIAETSFLIIPVTHTNPSTPIPDSKAAALHAGPPNNQYVSRDFHNFFDILNIREEERSIAKIKAGYDANKGGEALRKWVDGLTVGVYRLGEACVTERVVGCTDIPLCSQTRWSSLSPDPKSDLIRTSEQQFVNEDS